MSAIIVNRYNHLKTLLLLVPSRVIVRMCPDCPSLISDINAEIKAKADLLVEQYNKESNQTHYFKVDEIERVRTQVRWKNMQLYLD